MNEEKMKKYGPLFVLLSAICFSLGGLLLKYVPWSGLAANSARNIPAAVIIALFMLVTRHKFKFNMTVLIGALSISGTNILYCIANKLTTAGNTIILQFTMPVYVILFSMLIFHVKPKKLDIDTCIAVFVGVVFFFMDGLSAGNMLGNALALLSGVTYAGVFMMASSENSDSLSSTVLGMCISVIAGAPALLKQDFSATPKSAYIALLAIGVFQLGCAYICLNIGLKYTSATASSLISGVEPILNPTLVAIFYGEKLSTLSLIGAAIVFSAILFYNIKTSKTGGDPQ